LTVIKDAGVAVNTADKAAFIAASKPIYNDYASSVKGGDALISKVQNAAK
jgi:TRAP-type C4-dicarboxylate transport system substrate-binding protein